MKTDNITLGVMLRVVVGLFVATSRSALAMNEELVGAVVKTDQGAASSTDAGEYLIMGTNLPRFAGDTVAVTPGRWKMARALIRSTSLAFES